MISSNYYPCKNSPAYYLLLFRRPPSRSAKNIPEIKATMKKLRDVIGYFNLSTQANTKLLKFQSSSDIEEYASSRPKKLIQDVVTRWWSKYASIERALHLQKASLQRLRLRARYYQIRSGKH